MADDLVTRSGSETSEFEVAKKSSFWGTVSIVVGAVLAVGSVAAGWFDADSKLGIIIGAVVTVAGVVHKILVDRGYIASRTAVKEAAALTSDGDKE